MSLDSSMDKVLERRREVEARLSDSATMNNAELAQFSRELSDLRPVCEQIELVRRVEAELAEALVMVDEAGDDPDMLEMAQAEADLLKDQLPEARAQLQLLLLPKDKDDSRNAILEVRAGTGGDEAALFAANLFSMYQRFAAKHGWKFDTFGNKDFVQQYLEECEKGCSNELINLRNICVCTTFSSTKRERDVIVAGTIIIGGWVDKK